MHTAWQVLYAMCVPDHKRTVLTHHTAHEQSHTHRTSSREQALYWALRSRRGLDVLMSTALSPRVDSARRDVHTPALVESSHMRGIHLHSRFTLSMQHRPASRLYTSSDIATHAVLEAPLASLTVPGSG